MFVITLVGRPYLKRSISQPNEKSAQGIMIMHVSAFYESLKAKRVAFFSRKATQEKKAHYGYTFSRQSKHYES